jgi:hypothetical protein
MASIKSEKTLDDAEKAVQARQNGTEPFDEGQYQILRDRCKYVLPAFIFSSLKHIINNIPNRIDRNILSFYVKTILQMKR